MDKLKANMAAAGMLMLDVLEDSQLQKSQGGMKAVKYAYTQKPPANDHGHRKIAEFDLFTNDSDLVAVVKCLGERHKYAVTPVYNGWMVGHCDVPSVREEVYFKTCDTYEEAVGAACIATQEGEG